MSDSPSPTLRPATPEDLTDLRVLIEALADYEGLRHELRLDLGALREHLFGPNPCVVATLACIAGRPVGYALAFRNYSTFLCRQGWFLEDLFVLPEHRRRGIGRALLQDQIARARAAGCGRMEWYVLAWNQPAIALYESLGATVQPDWRVARIVF